MRRSLDERLRTAADCLSRFVWGLGPDPMPMQHERNTIGDKPFLLIGRWARSRLRTCWRRVSVAIRNRLSGRRCTPYCRAKAGVSAESVGSVLSVNVTIANKKVTLRNTMPGIAVFRNVKLQAPRQKNGGQANSNEIPNFNIQ
jgi:hypothetical protein